MRPYLNKVWVAEFDGLCSGEIIVLPHRTGLDSRFLAARLSAPDFVAFASQNVSGERPRVDFKKLSSFNFLLPPTAEQTRLVEKLTTTLSKLRSAEQAATRGLERVGHYRTSILKSAFTGDLSKAWRDSHQENIAPILGDLLARRRECAPSSAKYLEPVRPKVRDMPAIPPAWAWASAEALTDPRRPITYGIIKLGPETPTGIPTLRSSDIRHLRLDLAGVKRVSRKIANRYSRTLLNGGEVLVTVRGSLGGVICAPQLCRGYNVSREVAMIAPLDPNMAEIIAIFIGSDYLQRWMSNRTRGIAYTGINISTLREMPLPVPPPQEWTAIIETVRSRLSAADKLTAAIKIQIERSQSARMTILADAFAGKLSQTHPLDEPADALVQRLRDQPLINKRAPRPINRRRPKVEHMAQNLSNPAFGTEHLRAAWARTNQKADALPLFGATGLHPNQVASFYEALRGAPEILNAFKDLRVSRPRRQAIAHTKSSTSEGRFRLVKLWVRDFKNLHDYNIDFDPSQGLDVVLGWNGTGKSNLFEILVIIFRDLHDWIERNRWPEQELSDFTLTYEINDLIIDIEWNSAKSKRPEVRVAPIGTGALSESDWSAVKREELPLPRFVFGYYSGPTNRMAEHFLPMKQGHYDRLRNAKADDAETLARLLEQRRFFCAETHHAKYVLLGFSYKEDAKITQFLESKLRIVGFESALFVIRKPAWAKPGSKPDDFWGATGIMRRVMERLRRFAVAPMVLEQRVSYGYRSTTEDHYYFFLPDLASLHSFAAEYPDARTFFLALESTDFSELIHDVAIQVRVKSSHTNEVAITFHQMSEGEQQLLMVLGLMRFTKSHQSLVLLDEPDTHLNPHWSVDYLKDLAAVMNDGLDTTNEQQTSQILMATHDPLVIASLVKEQIHLLKRDPSTQACRAETPDSDPKGLGFTGILTSDMFGFRSDLDPETLADLDNRVRLIAREKSLSPVDRADLEAIDKRLARRGFSKAFSDPYYAAFLRAWSRKYADAMSGIQFLTPEKRDEIDRIADEILAEAIAEVEKDVGN